MREERVTKEIIKYLNNNNWFIFSYDFPQSGTGILVKQDNSNEKNKDSIIPDIIAIKDNTSIFFENKDRIVTSDFEKVNSLIVDNKYINNIKKLLCDYKISNYYYGIGLPDNINIQKLDLLKEKTDFILLVDKEYSVRVYYDNKKIFN